MERYIFEETDMERKIYFLGRPIWKGRYIFEETDIDGKEGKLGSMVCNVAAGTLVVVYLPALAFAVSHSYSLLSNCNPEISIFCDQVQSVFQAFVQISPEPNTRFGNQCSYQII